MNRRYSLMQGIVVSAAVMLVFSIASLSAAVSVKVCAFRGGDEAGRTEYFSQINDQAIWGSGVYPTDPAFSGKLLKLVSANRQFHLWCPGRIDPATSAWFTGVGMVKPTGANWFSNGFFSVYLNDEGDPGLEKYPATLDEATGGETSGVVQMSWRHPDALITVRFILMDGDDKLLMATNVESRSTKKIEKYGIKLLCYPSDYAGGSAAGAAIRNREALTNKRVIERPKSDDNQGYAQLALQKDECWILFYDKYFDPADLRGSGPCAALYSPRETSSVQTLVGNYACYLYLNYPAATVSHLMLWEFKDVRNQAAKDYMKNLQVK